MQYNKYDPLLIIYPIMSYLSLSNGYVLLTLFVLSLAHRLYLIDESQILKNSIININSLKALLIISCVSFPVIFYVFPEGLSGLWNFSMIKSFAVSLVLTFFLMIHLFLYIFLRKVMVSKKMKCELMLFILVILLDSFQTLNFAPMNFGHIVLYSIDNEELWRLLSISGISLFTAILYSSIIIVYKIIFKKEYLYFYHLMFLLLSVTFSLVINERYYDNLDSNNKIITVGVAQPNFKTARLINNKDHLVDELVELVIESNNEESDLIILPETIYPYTFNEKNSYTEEYYRTKFDLMSKNNAIIFGGFIKDNSKILNSVIIKEKQSSTFQYIPKTKLLPFGEYIPKIKYFPFFEKIFDEYVPYTANNLTNSIVEQSKTIFINELPININAVICYEVLFQEIVKSKIKNTDLLINLGQGSWFGESVFGVSGPAKWSFVHLRMRAIQNGIPVIRSSNTSGSYYINEKGVVINKIKPLVKGFFYEKVTLNRIETLYSIYGDWFKYVFSIILLLTIIIRKFIF